MKDKVKIENLKIKRYINSCFFGFEIINKDDLNILIGDSHYYYGLKSAIYEENGALISQTERCGGYQGDLVVDMNPSKITPFDAENVVKGKSLYIGHFFAHYGHFITEGISRLWLDNISDYDHYIMVPFLEGYDGIIFQEFHLSLYKSLGIDTKKIFILNDKTRIELMDVPERSLVINKDCNILHRKTLKKIVSHFCKNSISRNIYVSRTANDRIDNTKEVEKFFRDNGFDIILPGKMSFEDQVNTFYNASVVVGLPGAALHNNVFSKDNHILIELGDQRSWNSPISTQIIANQISNANDFFIPFDKSKNYIDIEYLCKELNKINFLNLNANSISNINFCRSYIFPAEYIFHISCEGDKHISQYNIENQKWKNAIEGFSIKTSENSPIKIKYMAIYNNKIEKDWEFDGGFVGTRGESKNLNGYIIDVVEGNNLFNIKCIGYFSNNTSTIVNSGELCISTDSFLIGIMILIEETKVFREKISF